MNQEEARRLAQNLSGLSVFDTFEDALLRSLPPAYSQSVNHFLTARIELLKALRSFLDARIERLEKARSRRSRAAAAKGSRREKVAVE